MHSDIAEFTLEVSDLYVGLMQVLEGSSTDAARSALAMTLLMVGENAGLHDQQLIDWIDAAAGEAKTALGQANDVGSD